MHKQSEEPAETNWRHRLHEVVFEADTLGGKVFDVVLLCLIILSVAVVVMESVRSWRVEYGSFFFKGGMGADDPLHDRIPSAIDQRPPTITLRNQLFRRH